MSSRLLTVVTPATSFDLTDLATVQDELGSDGGESDERLQRYITAASKWLAGECRRVFGKERVAETFRNGEAFECLVLDRRPVVVVSSVPQIVSIVEDGETLAAADYEVDVEGAMLYRLRDDRRARWSGAKIVVTYDAGYDLPGAAPDDLEEACIELVKGRNAARKRDPALRAVETPDVLREEFWVGAADLPACVAAAIANHRNILV